jgi:hypothetical protein
MITISLLLKKQAIYDIFSIELSLYRIIKTERMGGSDEEFCENENVTIATSLADFSIGPDQYGGVAEACIQEG